MIKPRGNNYVILSQKGKVLGRYPRTKAGKRQAVKRLGQIEYFKYQG